MGTAAGANVPTASNVICISVSIGQNVSRSCYIGNIHGETIDPAHRPFRWSRCQWKVGTTASSRRFKHDIKPMDKSSEAILALKPATFHYKNDTRGTPQFGLIAEEVAEVNPDLVMHDKNGEISSVRYDQVNGCC